MNGAMYGEDSFEASNSSPGDARSAMERVAASRMEDEQDYGPGHIAAAHDEKTNRRNNWMKSSGSRRSHSRGFSRDQQRQHKSGQSSDATSKSPNSVGHEEQSAEDDLDFYRLSNGAALLEERARRYA